MYNQEKPLPQLQQETNDDFLTLDEEQLEAVSGGIIVRTGIFRTKKEFPDNTIFSSQTGKIATPFEAKNKIFAKQNDQIYAGQNPTYNVTFEKFHGKTVPLAWDGEKPATI
jgi:hypothetical protein